MGVMFFGRDTSEYHKERVYNINVKKEVVEILGKCVVKEETELKKKLYTEKNREKETSGSYQEIRG